MKKLQFEDLLVVGGCISILGGVVQVSVIAALILGGVMMIGFGLMIGKVKGKK